MDDNHLKQRLPTSRQAKINPKTATWIGASVALMAFVMFSMMIVTYGYHKGWWV